MGWFRRPKPKFTVIQPQPQAPSRDRIPKDLWHKCAQCGAIVLRRDFVENLFVCPKCDNHARMAAADRLAILIDEGTFVEEDQMMSSGDPLGFVDEAPYPERNRKHQKKTGRMDAVICGVGNIYGVRTSAAIMDFAFSGGSMGSVVGEKVTRCMERALQRRLPVIVVSCTGGARMQEGILSLMQMAKTSAACARLSEARLPYISILTDPTTAGVMASYAMLGDVILAEPGALIGFAGPRVIEQTINQILPRGFQRSDFVRDHGFLDKVVHRRDLKATVGRLLRFFLEGLAAQGVALEQSPSEWPPLETGDEGSEANANGGGAKGAVSRPEEKSAGRRKPAIRAARPSNAKPQ